MSRRPRRMMNQINVVPYIDVMLVLLIIFMVATPMMTTGNVNLPSVGKAPQPPAQPIEVHLDENLQLSVVDRARKGAQTKEVSENELVGLLQDAQARNTEQPVLIAADKRVKYEAVMNLMDLLQKNQVQKVGLLVQQGKR
ncbi:ExbD/TolR family protein [Niveibacterium sp. COAC-50]|uniref:ExbD/TolR family protein n=1 Tax=Niveibacterium sp. COAC-50 TaxID=2729384 RepID=UPI0015554ABF|nr:ExbD/TolR family protein [Niveibacterium sp. COAC-50]